MLCYFWCVCDQIISRSINCLASTVTKYSHVFPANRSQEARAMTINRIYLFDTHQKSAERQRLCRLLSFATDFVKGLVHFCQSQSHDEMSVVRCFASWTHCIKSSKRQTGLIAGDTSRQERTTEKEWWLTITESLQLYIASLCESVGNNLRLQKIASYSSHLCTFWTVLNYWTVRLEKYLCIKTQVAPVYQCCISLGDFRAK